MERGSTASSGLHRIEARLHTNQPRPVKTLILGALACLLCSIGDVAAQPPPQIDREALTAEIRQRANRMADEMALTPDQRERTLSVIRGSLLLRWSALTSAWADGSLDHQERTRLASQFDTERRGVVATLRGFLSESQIATFRRLQAEETRRFQQEIRQGRYTSPTP